MNAKLNDLTDGDWDTLDLKDQQYIAARLVKEDVGREHVGCDSGACPVDFNSGSK
jgi:hypothetical protein